MTFRKLIESPDDFRNQLEMWSMKGGVMMGFEVMRFMSSEGFEYEPVVFDYVDPEVAYMNARGPYKTWRGAYSAIGYALDHIDAETALKNSIRETGNEVTK